MDTVTKESNYNMKRTDIINHLIEKNGYKRYLEIGVKFPEINYDSIKLDDKTGIEPYPIWNWHTKNIINITSNKFFEELKSDEKFDIILIDGLYTKEKCSEDILNSLKHLNEGGCILVHDLLPSVERKTLNENKSESDYPIYKISLL